MVSLSGECITELRWWASNLRRICSLPIRDVPLGRPFDSTIESNASDTGVGAVTFVEGAGAAVSTLVAALLALAPAGVSRRTVLRQARRGIEFMAALPRRTHGTYSTQAPRCASCLASTLPSRPLPTSFGEAGIRW